MRNFHSHNRYPHAFARNSFFNSSSYRFGKDMHSSQIIITQIENIINLLLRNHQGMSFHQRIDIKESKKAFVFRHLIAGNLTCDNSTEYCCHNLNMIYKIRQALLQRLAFVLNRNIYYFQINLTLWHLDFSYITYFLTK